LALVVRHLDHHPLDEELDGIPQVTRGDVAHLVVLGVHEREVVARAVEVLQRVMVQIGPHDLVFRAEAVLHVRPGHEVLHLGLHHAAPVPRRDVKHVEDAAGFPVGDDDHPDLDVCRWYHGLNPLLAVVVSVAVRKYKRLRYRAQGAVQRPVNALRSYDPYLANTEGISNVSPKSIARKRKGVSKAPARRAPQLKWLLSCGAILLLTFVVYIPSLDNDFTNWDDTSYVTKNPLLANPDFDAILKLDLNGNYHPLTMWSLVLDYRLSGLNPRSYH